MKNRDAKVKQLDDDYQRQVASVDAHNANERSAAAYYWSYYPQYWSYPSSPQYPDDVKVPTFDAEVKALKVGQSVGQTTMQTKGRRAIASPTCCFLVAGAGFEPTTFGL